MFARFGSVPTSATANKRLSLSGPPWHELQFFSNKGAPRFAPSLSILNGYFGGAIFSERSVCRFKSAKMRSPRLPCIAAPSPRDASKFRAIGDLVLPSQWTQVLLSTFQTKPNLIGEYGCGILSKLAASRPNASLRPGPDAGGTLSGGLSGTCNAERML